MLAHYEAACQDLSQTLTKEQRRKRPACAQAPGRRTASETTSEKYGTERAHKRTIIVNDVTYEQACKHSSILFVVILRVKSGHDVAFRRDGCEGRYIEGIK